MGMKYRYIIGLIIIICCSSIYFYMSRDKQDKTSNTSSISKDSSFFTDIGVLYFKPNILPYSEYVFIQEGKEQSSTKIDGTAFYFENTEKYKNKSVIQSFIEGKRVFIQEDNKNFDIKKEKNGISARYQDEEIDIVGYNDGLDDSTLEIVSSSVNHQIKLKGVIVQIHYDSNRKKIYIYGDKVTNDPDSIYVIDVNSGKSEEFSLQNPNIGMPKNFEVINDKIIFSASGRVGTPGTPDGAKKAQGVIPGALVEFDKNTATIKEIPLPYVETLGFYPYKDKFILTFGEGYIVEIDKEYNVIKEHNVTNSKYVWIRTRIKDNFIYALTPGSQTASEENILFAYDLENDMKEYKMTLPSKEAYALDFAVGTVSK